MRLASVRRSLFTNDAARSKFLAHLMTGTKEILQTGQGVVGLSHSLSFSFSVSVLFLTILMLMGNSMIDSLFLSLLYLCVYACMSHMSVLLSIHNRFLLLLFFPFSFLFGITDMTASFEDFYST